MPEFLVVFFSAFILGGWLFWPMLFLFWVVVAWASDNEKYSFTTFVVAAFIAIQYVFGSGIPFLNWAIEHPLISISGYLVCGTLYLLYRFFMYVRDWRKKYDSDMNFRDTLKRGFLSHAEHKEEISTSKEGESIIPAGLEADYQEWVNTSGWTKRLTSVQAFPLARNHKAKLANWGTYWVWSLFWHILGDLLNRIWREIVEQVSNLADNLSAKYRI